MMGRRQEAQASLFYEFSLDDHVPQDHLLRSIDRFVDLNGTCLDQKLSRGLDVLGARVKPARNLRRGGTDLRLSPSLWEKPSVDAAWLGGETGNWAPLDGGWSRGLRNAGGAGFMHIVMTANTSWNIWNFRRPLIRAFLADGHRVTVIAPPDETVEHLLSLGCAVRPLEMDAKGLNPFGALGLAHRFFHVFRTDRPDVVLSYTIKNNLFAAFAAWPLGVPVVPNVTGLGTAFLSGGALQRVAEFLYRRAFGRLGVVFFQNKDDLDLFRARGLVREGQARLLPGSGIDLDHFAAAEAPAAGTPPVFLMIARLLRDKGVEEFVAAARMVRETHPEARFQLLGAIGSENRSAIDEACVRGWVAEGVVEYLGTASDVRPAIEDAACVVLPSYREGAPRTLIEAAAMARPLITTDVPGCRSVVDHDVSGFQCEIRSANSLAAALRRFLDLSFSARVEMGLAGRAKMEREFGEAIVVGAYRDAIRDVMGAG